MSIKCTLNLQFPTYTRGNYSGQYQHDVRIWGKTGTLMRFPSGHWENMQTQHITRVQYCTWVTRAVKLQLCEHQLKLQFHCAYRLSKCHFKAEKLPCFQWRIFAYYLSQKTTPCENLRLLHLHWWSTSWVQQSCGTLSPLLNLSTFLRLFYGLVLYFPFWFSVNFYLIIPLWISLNHFPVHTTRL